MRAKLGLIAALIILLVACSKPDAYDIDGNEFTLSEHKGKWVIINYWAAWCSPCVAEMPALALLSHQYSDQVVVIGVNYDRWDGERQKTFTAKLDGKIDYPLFQYFPAQELELGTVSVLPTTFLVNPEGKLHDTIVGDKTLQEFVELMELN